MSADSGASNTYPKQCSALRKGEHVLIKGFPCKITNLSTSKTGKHGHAKVNLTGVDIFDSKKHEDICPSTHNMNVPIVNRKEYVVTYVDPEGFMHLMDDVGVTRADLKVPDSLKQKLPLEYSEADISVLVVSAMNQEVVSTPKTLAEK